jgi:ATP-dependent protease ClpP protease subunit/uncharacterized protein with PIN domain
MPKPKFYSVKKIRAQNGSNIGRVDIYGDIDAKQFWGDEVTPSGIIADLKALSGVSEIECHIFSEGGDMFASLAIYNILYSRPEKVSVYIDGLAASGGSVIACAGDMVYMAPVAMMYVHNLLTSVFNTNEHGVRELLDEMIKMKEPMVNAYMQKSGRTREEVIALMDGENNKGTWLTADEAIEFGLADAYTPDNMLPLEAAACISPGVFNYRGHRIDFTKYDQAAEKTAGIINSIRGGNSMAWFKPKNKPKTAAKVKPKAEITFVETVCPHCNGTVNLNPETGEIFAGGAKQAEPQGGENNASEAVLARRLPGNIRAAIFTIPCPHCGEEFLWDPEANSDGDAGQETQEAIPLGGSENAGKAEGAKPGGAKPNGTTSPASPPAQNGAAPAAKAKAKAKPKALIKPKAELANSVCPSCGAEFQYDTEQVETGTDEAGTEGYILTCPECGAEYIEPLAAAEPTTIPVGTTAQAAYRMGVLAERERILALEEMSQAAPGVETMIAAAIKTGASVSVMSRNVFKAMKNNPNIKAAQYIQAIRRDADESGVNSLRLPQHHDKKASFAESVFEKLENR